MACTCHPARTVSSEKAGAGGATPQYVRRAIAAGDLAALRRVGQTVILDDLAVQVWDRSRSRGRRWSPDVRRAAFALLDRETANRLTSSDQSRLRAKLRAMDARQIAHRAGGVGGGWGRYRRGASRVELRGVDPIGVVPNDQVVMGLVGDGPHVTWLATGSLDDFELDNDVVLDASGELVVLERAENGGRIRSLLDTYLLGSARESAAASALIEGAAREL